MARHHGAGDVVLCRCGGAAIEKRAGCLRPAYASLACYACGFTMLINTKADAVMASLTSGRSPMAGAIWDGPYVLPRDIKTDEAGIPIHSTPGAPAVEEVSPEVTGVMLH